jgi:tungstate transport system substrate-binding protein
VRIAGKRGGKQRAFASPRPSRSGRWLAIALAVALAFPSVAVAGPKSIILATTTSTQDSGLLDELIPLFERTTGFTVKTIAVGTGQALAMGDRGEADVVLVHAPKVELAYLAKGTLVNRRRVMHNDYVLVGPANDPARIREVESAAEALERIARRAWPFVSRGDNSGTHSLERELWARAGVEPAGDWYLESGQGMGQTLTIASEKDAYTLTDRATYLAFRSRIELAVLLEGDAPLLNVYHVMEVNSSRHPRVNAEGGRAFADFIVSPDAQAVIKTYGVEKYGRPLFFPDAGTPAPERGR